MTDQWQKAREAAIGDALKAGGWANDDETFKIMASYLDAALSAFSAAGWELVPRKASEAMVLAGTDSGITDPDGWATGAYEIEQLWPLIITAALKERQT